MTRFNRHLKLASKASLNVYRGNIPFIGYDKNGNIGDEELFKIISEFDIKLATGIHKLGRYLKIGTSGQKYFSMGGGTLLFSPDILKHSKKLKARGLMPVLFGTGGSTVALESCNKQEWEELLRGSDHIYVRGNYTKELLSKINIESTILGDLGFLRNLAIDAPKTAEDHIVVIPRSIRPSNYKLFSLDFKIREILANVIEELLTLGYKIKVWSVSVDDHAVVAGWIKQFSNRVEFKKYQNNFDDFQGDISTAKMLFSMRMHPGIFAASWGVPSILLDSREKYFDSFSVFDTKENITKILDPSSTSEKTYLENILELAEETDEQRLNRFNSVRVVAEKQQSMMKKLSKELA